MDNKTWEDVLTCDTTLFRVFGYEKEVVNRARPVLQMFVSVHGDEAYSMMSRVDHDGMDFDEQAERGKVAAFLDAVNGASSEVRRSLERDALPSDRSLGVHMYCALATCGLPHSVLEDSLWRLWDASISNLQFESKQKKRKITERKAGTEFLLEPIQKVIASSAGRLGGLYKQAIFSVRNSLKDHLRGPKLISLLRSALDVAELANLDDITMARAISGITNLIQVQVSIQELKPPPNPPSGRRSWVGQEVGDPVMTVVGLQEWSSAVECDRLNKAQEMMGECAVGNEQAGLVSWDDRLFAVTVTARHAHQQTWIVIQRAIFQGGWGVEVQRMKKMGVQNFVNRIELYLFNRLLLTVQNELVNAKMAVEEAVEISVEEGVEGVGGVAGGGSGGPRQGPPGEAEYGRPQRLTLDLELEIVCGMISVCTSDLGRARSFLKQLNGSGSAGQRDPLRAYYDCERRERERET